MSLSYLYSAGTVSVGNGSTTVTGTGTQWVAAGIREGDDFRANGLVGVIASVDSNTSLTLANGWAGVTISSGDYSIRLIDDAQRSLAEFNKLLLALGSGNLTSLAKLDASANEMPYFTGAGVMALTGLTSQGRSLLSQTILSRSGDTIVTDTAARIVGGAVTSSSIDTTSGRVPINRETGIFGLGATATAFSMVDLNSYTTPSGFYAIGSGTANRSASPWGNTYCVGHVQRYGASSLIVTLFRPVGTELEVYQRYGDSGTGWTAWREFYHTGNTTVDSNGFVKEASPIVRLFSDRAEEPVEQVGASMTRHGVGSYTLSGVPPLATEGWQIEVPQDGNGNRLVFVETSYTGNTLTVTTSTPAWNAAQGVWAAGDPVDIHEGRWVDLRFWKEPEAELVD